MTLHGPQADVRTPSKGNVLISGASIAGVALAFWLRHHGFTVTVVEKASGPRRGGYPIDVRGTALEVVQRMGILPRLRDAHVDMRRITFLDADGDQVTSLDPHVVAGSVDGRDLEVRRGDLVAALYAAVDADVEFVFDEAVATLDQSPQGVEVTFRGGDRREFDLVIGADGLHSRTREVTFGPEERFHRYLGYCFAGFTMPNTLDLSHEVVLWNTPGRGAALAAVRDSDDLHVLLNIARPAPPYGTFRNPEAQRDLVAAEFADAGWEVPRMLAAMREADDLFFDVVSQIHLPDWSKGRVALVGDAAYAPSFLTGQGTSLALVGAYMLADSLNVHPNHTEAFAAYRNSIGEYVALNQAQVGTGDATLFPTTASALEQRNARLRALTTVSPSTAPPSAAPPSAERPAHSALTLPEFTPSP